MNDTESRIRFKAIKKQFAKHKAEYDKENGIIVKPKAKYRHKAYMCHKCKIFHKYIYKSKPSKTHKDHFKHFVKYKENYNQTELWTLGFKKEWNRESNRTELQKRKGTKQ